MELDGTIPMTNRSARKPTGLPRGPASQPEPKYQSPIAKGGAFSDEAFASTRAAEQKGINDAAIRNGSASDATRATNPDLVAKIAADTAAMAPLAARPPTSSRVVSSRPATAQESKDGKAREIPAIQPTPEPSAKSKPKFARR